MGLVWGIFNYSTLLIIGKLKEFPEVESDLPLLVSHPPVLFSAHGLFAVFLSPVLLRG